MVVKSYAYKVSRDCTQWLESYCTILINLAIMHNGTSETTEM